MTRLQALFCLLCRPYGIGFIWGSPLFGQFADNEWELVLYHRAYCFTYPQPMGAIGGNDPSLVFGLDEFMAITVSKGLPASDVQIMVNLKNIVRGYRKDWIIS